MSKQKISLQDYICKPLIGLVLIQIVILFLFLWAYNENAYITLEDCHSKSIIVDKKELDQGYKYSNFYIVYAKETYMLSEVNHSAKELDSLISLGELINIHYIDKSDYFYIVDARNENEVYVDINEYNRESQLSNVFMIITFSIVEILYLALTKFFGIFDDIASFYKDLKKKQDKLKKKNSKSQSNN